MAKLSALVAFILGLSALASNDSNTNVVTIDPVTAKDTERAFQEALKEELPGLKDVRLLATQPQKVVAAPHTPASGSPSAVLSKAPSSPDEVSDFEKDVTDLVLGLAKGGGGAAGTPMGSSVQKIKDLIEKEMMTKVNAAHEANQKELVTLAKAVEACGTTKDTSTKKALAFQTVYTGKSATHKTCRTTEAGLYTDTLETWKDMKSKKKIKEGLCKSFSELSKKLGEQSNNKQIVAKSNGEAVETYVKRITRTICGNPVPGGKGKGGKGKGGAGKGGAGKGGFLDLLLVAKEKCEKSSKEYNAARSAFIKLDKQWHSRRAKCDNVQDMMDGGACKYAVAMKDTCETFEECWHDKKEAYDVAEKATKQEEIDRKAEWKGLKRMLCIIDAFTDSKVTSDEIKKCKDKTHDTSHLAISYPVIKPMGACKVPEGYPSTGAYKKAEFIPLPALAKGKVDANDCTGMTEIATEPAVGSPKGCKCARVTLNGPYSAGAMVKCTNCKDIRRSTDKSSCPLNTKLFSPQGRTDWDTFLKSEGPLRSPHWVIDVTRPQNGCGGCTKHPMNSKTKPQSTWKTQDGSPWWLRSSRYNEPNGDYQANCYLDLWKTPKNADSVTFNDYNCKYHSKSYFCQAKKVAMSPKKGSPTGCVCKKVEIALGSTYSPGVLLKCTNCLKVSKSNEKNSCPAGTKLFAPRSRDDWKAFIRSATPLRAPYWIIDVTRPQNGCGGCTRHPMNKKSAAQATWKTADNAPWWLRSRTYNEPNGDYKANCYMDLWHSPANENSVTFNDWNCKYYAKSYYCQSVKARKKKVVTTTAPPWKAPVKKSKKTKKTKKTKKR